jgi:hypothetical protein
MLAEYDIVTLAENLDELGLKAGSIGTIVMAHNNADAFEVEFVNLLGETLAVETIAGKQLRLAAIEESNR